MSIRVEILNTSDPACDAFVTQMAGAKISHLSAWSVAVARAAGLKNFYLIARRNSEIICGVLPLMQVSCRLFGNRLVSQAFSNYGGVLVDSPESRDALLNYATELADELNCESIEFRNIDTLPYDLESRPGKICMYLPLSCNPDELWKSFNCKVRNQVRKAEKSDITAVSGGVELLDDFYRVYTVRMRQLGTPCYPRKLMLEALQTFPENSQIFTVRFGNLTIGGGFTTCFKEFVEIPWAATLVKYNKLCPNNLLYWSAIKYYCLAGAKCFDFGRCSVNSSTYRFKKQWGAEPVDLHYQYWLQPGRQLGILTPDNPKYKRKVKVWKRLPLWVTRLIGPYISRYLA